MKLDYNPHLPLRAAWRYGRQQNRRSAVRAVAGCILARLLTPQNVGYRKFK